jgi:hypothetical protein
MLQQLFLSCLLKQFSQLGIGRVDVRVLRTAYISRMRTPRRALLLKDCLSSFCSQKLPASLIVAIKLLRWMQLRCVLRKRYPHRIFSVLTTASSFGVAIAADLV